MMKNVDVAVRDAIKAGVDGTFEGGYWVGTLRNGGVGIAGFHAFDDDVPADLKAELEEIRQGVISGVISTR